MKLAVPKIATVIAIMVLIVSVLLGIGIGAVKIAPIETIGILCKRMGIHTSIQFTDMQESVLMAIRLPRVVLAVLVGASLSIAGASMQGLFRNPLAEPGLIGVSAGASLAAVTTIVIGDILFHGISSLFGFYTLSITTFLGAFITTMIVYRLSQLNGKTVITTMLLVGIAINALTSAVTGMLTYSASDAQLRSITFWTFGSLGGATWNGIMGILPFVAIPLVILPTMSKALNAFTLGEANAMHLGVNTERVKNIIVLLTALCVGASVALTGIINFVGLIVPHTVRTFIGPDHRYLLTLSAISGAILMVNADLVARTIFVPAEIPIGIITSIIGAPFFLYLLLKERKTTKKSVA